MGRFSHRDAFRRRPAPRAIYAARVTDARQHSTVSPEETIRANRRDWDRTADEYQAEHGEFLRDVGFIWSPEGLDEGDVRLLGEVWNRRVLEVGCGAGQCARWLLSQGASVVGLDLSFRQLQHSRRIDDATGLSVPVVCASATAVPLDDDGFDLACSAFGALPFLSDVDVVMREVARVLRPGGRWVFAVTHPLRWIFPDDPTQRGLTAVRPYFDHTPYVERDEHGDPSYVEHHHTMSDWIRAAVGAGFVVEDLVEPEWPEGHDRVWGAWGPDRGRFIPGTAIFVCTLR
jgi:SAM-dependent methyltransferase